MRVHISLSAQARVFGTATYERCPAIRWPRVSAIGTFPCAPLPRAGRRRGPGRGPGVLNILYAGSIPGRVCRNLCR